MSNLCSTSKCFVAVQSFWLNEISVGRTEYFRWSGHAYSSSAIRYYFKFYYYYLFPLKINTYFFSKTQGKQIIQEIPFNPPIHAFYENNALNASIRYSLMSEFDDDVFHIDPIFGRMYLDKEIDADSLPSNIFLFKVIIKSCLAELYLKGSDFDVHEYLWIKNM